VEAALEMAAETGAKACPEKRRDGFSSPDSPDPGTNAPVEPLRLEFGPPKINSYRIIAVPLNFIVERLVIGERRRLDRGWVVTWETVGYYTTLGGACERILNEKIAGLGRIELEELVRTVKGLAQKINAECSEINKTIYQLRRAPRQKRGTPNA